MATDEGADGEDAIVKLIAQGPSKPEEDIIKLDLDGSSSGKRRGQNTRVASVDGNRLGRGLQEEENLKDRNPDKQKYRRSRQKDERIGSLPEGMRKFTRGEGTLRKAKGGVGDPKLKTVLKKNRKREQDEVQALVQGQILQTEEQGTLEAEGEERSYRVTQRQLAREVTVGAAKKQFEFTLPYGPYRCSYTENGRYLIAGGRKGHIAMLECENMKICCEMQAKETVHDVQALHNHLLFAVARKKYTFIYDNAGTEVHCMDYQYCSHLEFLPYHFLLVLAGENKLHYRDISTGDAVVSHTTHLGPVHCMRQNPYNAVVHLGHSKGLVSLWTPSVKEPVMRILTHPGHVTGLAVQQHHMVTTGAEGTWKVWDLRKTDATLAIYTRKCNTGFSACDVDISMTGLVGLCVGSEFQVWKDAFKTSSYAKLYMSEDYGKNMVSCCRFRPFEDVCGVGLADGFAGLLIPGSGIANYDSFEANPFESKKQRREREVRRLIEKLQPDTIMVDPHKIGNINPAAAQEYKSDRMEFFKQQELANKKVKKKMRGRNKVGNRMKRKNLKQAENQRDRTKSGGKGATEGGDASDDDDEGEDDGENDDEDDAGDSGEAAEQGQSASKRREGDGTALGRFYGKRRRT